MSTKKNVLLTTSAAPSQSPFSTTEKRLPIGIGFLISVLRDAGHEVFFIDNYLKPSDFLETDYLIRNEIDIVGIYANTICYRDTLRMFYKLEYMRQSGKWKGKIIVGGPHTTVALETIPDFVDFVVQGEGEQAILDIVEGKVKDRIVRYPPLKDLDVLPMPAWDYFIHLPYKWTVDWFSEAPVFTMNTSRGCPFRCAFCSVGSIWGKQYTFFSAERVVADIEHLIQQYDAKGIYFREDNFTLNKARLRRFCNLLIEKDIRISWSCESRVNTLDRETLELMHRAGLRAFYFGVESGSQRILDFMKKGITIEQTRNVFKLCHEFGIKTAASIIVGVPNETEDDIKQTAILLNEIKPTVTWYNVFVGIPDSELYRYSIDNKLYEFIDDRKLVYLKGHNERVKRFYGKQWNADVPVCLNNPAISVVMSVFNGAPYLESAIKSVLNQTFQDFEFIIVDDASTDKTAEILKTFADPRIRIITNPDNIGLTKSLNKGISLARGRYIVRMDADDVSLPHRFEIQADFLDKNPDYALIGSSYYQMDNNGKITSLINVLTDNQRIAAGLKEQNWFGHGSVMIRKDAFLRVSGYDEKYKFSQDYDLWLRISEHYKVANSAEPLYCWRISSSGISSEKRREQRYYAEMAVTEALQRQRMLAKSQPLVSVIVPTYNRPDMLAEAIKSILQQTYRNFEVIVVNDAGVDVGNIISSLNTDNNITYIKHGGNRGLAAARNTGIRSARGEYIALLDDDDIFYKHHLETAVQHLCDNASRVVYTDASRATFSVKDRDYELVKKNVPYSIDYDRNKLLLGNLAPVNCFVFSRELAIKAGFFDETLSTLEDWDFWIRLSALTPFKHIKKVTVQVNWRTDGSTMTSSRKTEFKMNRNRIYKNYQDELSKIPNRNEILAEFNAIWSSDFDEKREKSGVFREAVKGLTSIVILTFNQFKYTRECVESIRKHTPEPHEIIFVDNGSTDGTVKWLKKLLKENPNYKLIENHKNLGFPKGCNQGINASSGESILLLNNDVVVTNGWLSGMLECLNSAPDIGIVGPMTNNISGTQKVEDTGYQSMADLNVFAQSFRERNRHRRIPMRRIVGFCMLFRRELVQKIGLLDETFGTGNFEDDDFCLRAALEGYKNFIAGDIFIHHYGSRSFRGNRIDYGSAMTGNRKIFEEKWSGIERKSSLGEKAFVLNTLDAVNTLNQKGKVDAAVGALLEGIRLAPAEKRLYYALSEMLIDAKQFKDAYEILKEMSFDESDLRRLELIGYCAEGMEFYDEAEGYAGRALSLNPASAPALNLKGILAHKKGDNEKAQELFQNAIKADPGFGEPYTNSGVLKWAAGRREEALDLLERGCILSPTVSDIVTIYHSAISTLVRFDRAEKVFREALAIYPLNRRIAFLLIDTLIQQGKNDIAMKEIEKAMLTFGIDEGILSAALKIRETLGPRKIEGQQCSRATLSLCMIVKNEEAYIAQCLMSVAPVIDEMIIVDTGSTDRTKDIAQAFGAQVYDFQWTHNFAEARNFSLAQAHGDWVIVLDADEVISSRDHAALTELIKKKKPVGYSFTTRNYTGNVNIVGWVPNDGNYHKEEAGDGWFPSQKVRLFPSDPRIRFENPVHEFVEHSLQKEKIEIERCRIPVHHYGKLDHERESVKKDAYYELGKTKLQEKGDDLQAISELAIVAGTAKKYEEAIELWQRTIAIKPDYVTAFLNLGHVYLQIQRYEDALAASKRAVELAPSKKEAVVNYASAEVHAGDVKKAISVLEHLLNKIPEHPPAIGVLAAAYCIEGEKEKGLAYIEKIKKLGFNCSEFLYKHARSLISAKRTHYAIRLLEAAVESNHVNNDITLLLSELQSRNGCERLA